MNTKFDATKERFLQQGAREQQVSREQEARKQCEQNAHAQHEVWAQKLRDQREQGEENGRKNTDERLLVKRLYINLDNRVYKELRLMAVQEEVSLAQFMGKV